MANDAPKVHYWEHGSIGPFTLTSPMVLGHESSGIVTSVGPAVTSLRRGDNVALEPGVPCRRCEPCLGGKYNLCLNMAFAATPPIDGTLAKYYVLPEDFCHKLPANVGLEEGALMEPLSVAVHIVKQGRVQPGHSVVIFGVGPVGLLCCAVARAFGASKVIAVDIQPARLEFAAQYAATGIYEPVQEGGAEQSVQLCLQHGLGRGADVVIDASGVEASVHMGIHVLRTGGTYVQGGMGRDVVSFPIVAVCTKEVDVRGSFRYGSGDYKLALTLVEEGKVDVKKLVTGIMAFEEAEQALLNVKAGNGIKTLIRGVEN
ncbi:xylitol dehydrogenase [Histoplasma capsulatum G186AR]|uniref:D-xylulose reductase n=2 Tax=Ajellomyces capsulatus TaxID=5037 RepID=C0NAY4_AJECG|nr:xylitol dehydrogenase [Histoplasma capsulatum G186AR]EEH10825.1 xylitol dehydrogenase [Histoplasma capsulatum G186AR]